MKWKILLFFVLTSCETPSNKSKIVYIVFNEKTAYVELNDRQYAYKRIWKEDNACWELRFGKDPSFITDPTYKIEFEKSLANKSLLLGTCNEKEYRYTCVFSKLVVDGVSLHKVEYNNFSSQQIEKMKCENEEFYSSCKLIIDQE